MASQRDPRTSPRWRLAADDHPVPHGDVRQDEADRGPDRRHAGSGDSDPAGSGITAAETVGFVVALIVVVVLVALL
jgi:hypothetical protein